ncbi:MAG: hypothetical protein JXB10_19850 [Pirellulales bacterium]|nr:hypothetical protein [Pirellulales bacterium]
MRRLLRACFSCSVLLTVLGGCNGRSDSGGPLSFAARIQKAEKQKDPHLRARQLLRIVDDQFRARDVFGAEDTLQLARLACRKIPEPVTQAHVFALLIEADALLDNKTAARRDFEAAGKALESIEEKGSKARALARLGQAQGVIKDDAGQAVATVRRAEKLAAELTDPLARGLTLIAAAEAFGKLGKTAEADRVIAQILQTAQAVPKGRSRVQLLAQTALLQHVLKRKDAAKKTFELAVETAEKLENLHQKANALADIAVEFSKTGDAKRTRQLLDQAENAAAKIPERDLQQQTLFRVRTLMSKLPKGR